MKFKFEILEKYRVSNEDYFSRKGDTFGVFFVPFESNNLLIIATDGIGIHPQWEHVSVSLKKRCPNWKEMSYVKSLFWDDSETVIQFHPKSEEYINNHSNCLHLWKKSNTDHELPPYIYVGLKK